MKIIYFHQHFNTPYEAGGTRSYEFAQRLLARGHEVTMVAGGSHDLHLLPTNHKRIFRGNVDGIDVIQIALPYSNNDGIAKRTITFLKYAWKGIQLAMREDYDLLFATSTPLTAGIPGIVAKWFRNKPFVFEVRDLWPELPKALGMKNPFLLGGMGALEKLSYMAADGCIGLSPGICEGIRKRSKEGKPITMIPNGCDLSIFRPGKREDLRMDGIDAEDFVAVFTGAHGVANGLDSILDVAVVLKQRGRKDIKLVFIGDGKVKPHLMKRAQAEQLDNCKFFNPIPKKELNEVMACADVGLMVLANVPAFYYGTSPNKFFDYISSGLPVVNNYPGWLADMIQENRCGIVAKPSNPNSFADALIELADSEEKRKKYGKNARLLAEMQFGRIDLANRFVDFLEMIDDNYKHSN